MLEITDYEIGDVICYVTCGSRRYVKVTHKDDNIKNGMAGFDGVTIDTKMDVWGYDHQIVAIERSGVMV